MKHDKVHQRNFQCRDKDWLIVQWTCGFQYYFYGQDIHIHFGLVYFSKMNGSYKSKEDKEGKIVDDGMELETRITMQRSQVYIIDTINHQIATFISRYLLKTGLQRTNKLLLLGQISQWQFQRREEGLSYR